MQKTSRTFILDSSRITISKTETKLIVESEDLQSAQFFRKELDNDHIKQKIGTLFRVGILYQVITEGFVNKTILFHNQTLTYSSEFCLGSLKVPLQFSFDLEEIPSSPEINDKQVASLASRIFDVEKLVQRIVALLEGQRLSPKNSSDPPAAQNIPEDKEALNKLEKDLEALIQRVTSIESAPVQHPIEVDQEDVQRNITEQKEEILNKLAEDKAELLEKLSLEAQAREKNEAALAVLSQKISELETNTQKQLEQKPLEAKEPTELKDQKENTPPKEAKDTPILLELVKKDQKDIEKLSSDLSKLAALVTQRVASQLQELAMNQVASEKAVMDEIQKCKLMVQTTDNHLKLHNSKFRDYEILFEDIKAEQEKTANLIASQLEFEKHTLEKTEQKVIEISQKLASADNSPTSTSQFNEYKVKNAFFEKFILEKIKKAEVRLEELENELTLPWISFSAPAINKNFFSLSNYNQTARLIEGKAWRWIMGEKQLGRGLHKFSVKVENTKEMNMKIGIVPSYFLATDKIYDSIECLYYDCNVGKVYNNGQFATPELTKCKKGDVITVETNLKIGSITFYVNTVQQWAGSVHAGFNYYPCVVMRDANDLVSLVPS